MQRDKQQAKSSWVHQKDIVLYGLLPLLEEVYEKLNEGSAVNVVQATWIFQKTFDKVPHNDWGKSEWIRRESTEIEN